MNADSPDPPPKESLKKNWTAGASGESQGVMFLPEELDIFIDKITGTSFIYHGKHVDYERLDHLEYDPQDHSVDVVMKDGSRLDLGVKIQWLVRPYFTRSREIKIVRTKDGESIDGVSIPLIHIKKEKKKKK